MEVPARSAARVNFCHSSSVTRKATECAFGARRAFLIPSSSHSAAARLALNNANTGCISKLWSSNISKGTLIPENKSLVVHFFICLAKYSLIPVSVSLDMLCRPCSIATLRCHGTPRKKIQNDRSLKRQALNQPLDNRHRLLRRMTDSLQ